MKPKQNTPYTDVSTVESLRNEVIPEEFPKDPTERRTMRTYWARNPRGSPPSTPRRGSPMKTANFTREFPGQDPGSHPTHDRSPKG